MSFKPYMYKNICPIAAAHMDECYRCAHGNTCVEYQKFRDEAEFKAYQTLSWLPEKHLKAFVASGASVGKYADIASPAAFEAAMKATGHCEKVAPGKASETELVAPAAHTATHKGPVYKKVVVTFGKMSFKPYMYKNICPIAAAHMDECYRCAHGNTCVEYQKFRDEAEFKAYQTLSWLPEKHLKAFVASGASVGKYADIASPAAFEAAMKATGHCEKVAPGK